MSQSASLKLKPRRRANPGLKLSGAGFRLPVWQVPLFDFSSELCPSSVITRSLISHIIIKSSPWIKQMLKSALLQVQTNHAAGTCSSLSSLLHQLLSLTESITNINKHTDKLSCAHTIGHKEKTHLNVIADSSDRSNDQNWEELHLLFH